MFTIVVATAPTEETALVYEIQLKELRNQLPCLRNCKLLACIPDPKGRRIGSGGGTLNALDALKNKLGKDALIKEKILMIHSGGDSRRSPTHSGNNR
jgi:fucokinase